MKNCPRATKTALESSKNILKVSVISLVILLSLNAVSYAQSREETRMLKIVMELVLEVGDKLATKGEKATNQSLYMFNKLKEQYDPHNDLFLEMEIEELNHFRKNLEKYMQDQKWYVLKQLKEKISKKVERKAEYYLTRIRDRRFTSKDKVFRVRHPWDDSAENIRELRRIWSAQLFNEYLGLYPLVKDKRKVISILEERYSNYRELYSQRSDIEFYMDSINVYLRSFGYFTHYTPAPSYVEHYFPMNIKARCKEQFCVDILRRGSNFIDLQYLSPRSTIEKIRKYGKGSSLGILPSEFSQLGPVVFEKLPVKLFKKRNYRIISEMVNKRKLKFVYYPTNRGDYPYNDELGKLLSDHPNIDGFILDMRNSEAQRISDMRKVASFFLKSGPVGQVVDRIQAETQYIEASNVSYDGPLLVILDHTTAGFLELLAANFKDSNRAILLGSRSKGGATVLTEIPLSRFLKTSSIEPGILRVGMAELYRLNGRSLGHGVKPDLTMPKIISDLSECVAKGPTKQDIGELKFDRYNIDQQKLDNIKHKFKRRVRGSKLLQKASSYFSKICEKTEMQYGLSLQSHKKQRKAAIYAMELKRNLYEKELYIKEAIQILKDYHR